MSPSLWPIIYLWVDPAPASPWGPVIQVARSPSSRINRSPNRSWLTWLFNRRSTVPSDLQMPMLWFALASDESPVRSESFIPPPFSPVWTRPSNEDLPTARWGSALPLESTPGFEEWEQLVQLLELPRYWTTNIWASYLASPWDEREGRFDSNPGPDLESYTG